MTRAALALICLAATATAGLAQTRKAPEPKKPDPMSFRIVSSNPDVPLEQQNRWVVAKGQIVTDTPKVFDAFVKSNDISGLTIYFDSTGGSIQGGIQLGDALRRLNARVSVGRSSPVHASGSNVSDDPNTPPRHQLSPNLGQCFSSCTYAFLGGRTRTVPIGAQFGVHMFWPGDKLEGIYDRTYSYEEVERAQRVSATLASYIQRMDVDLRMLDLAARTPPKGTIRRLTAREITDMRIAAISTGVPVFAQPQGWGLLTFARSATLTTGGYGGDPAAPDTRYVLEFSCGPEPGFLTARLDISLIRPATGSSVLAVNRVVVASGRQDGVITTSGKDIRPRPDPFNRLMTINANAWLSKSGTLPEGPIENASNRPEDGLMLKLNDFQLNETRSVRVPTAGLGVQYKAFMRACEKFRTEKTGAPTN